ncbi:MAG: hypothetical protein ACKVPJ_12735 [Chitinophagales bacterium]
MLKKLSFIFAIGIAAAFAAGCSEQIKIEKTLTSGQGRWKIDELQYIYDLDTFAPVYSTYDDVGEIIFYETGNGVWIQYDTNLLVDVAHYFEWENTENALSFQFDDIPTDIPETIFDIVTNSDDSIRLRTELSTDSIGLPLLITTELLLQRADELTHL